ncbi:HTH-type transcriptional activator RhaR [Methylobacterium crusticola]|uniref:HTH-type transcriptional activator RhaR n=1 Tax=Methylobacterium crusticola TaxID=1697972 RepID=A0ABQ4R7U3_9HYPH|nr:helix-turn-helix transcriptional regulator [Methylobacterium crusticola]GJD52807.1 HTH-type transcriptional activator RhaR [Methylobacterium crusticola]
MTTSGQILSPSRQAAIRPYETAPRPLVGFAKDYAAGDATGLHAHPRAQLLYAVSGVMRIDTPRAAYMVPPSTALFLPAGAPHAVRMDGPVAMRALFLREDAATRVATRTAVITVSALLREVILAACAEPLHWDLGGRGHHLAELALDEIARAASLPLGLPMPRDPRLCRAVAALRARPDDPRGLDALAALSGASSRTLARLFRAETGLSFRQWRQQARMSEALSALTDGASPARAAAIAGFASQPAFGAAFRGLFGITPGQARQRGRPAAAAHISTRVPSSTTRVGGMRK